MCLPIVLVPVVVVIVVVILLLVVADAAGAAAPVAVSVILQGHTTMPQSLTPQLKSFWSLRPKAKSSAQASLLFLVVLCRVRLYSQYALLIRKNHSILRLTNRKDSL